MRIFEVKRQQDKVDQIRKFAEWAIKNLKIKGTPVIKYGNDLGQVKQRRTFGSTTPSGDIWVHVGERNTADTMRTLCHELVHFRQFEVGTAKAEMSDEQRQKIEDEANAIAGRMMRAYGKIHEEIYESRTGSIQQDVADALPETYVIPELKNQDPYLQYRFGVALASAKGRAQRAQDDVPPFDSQSEWGENAIIVGYGAEDIGEWIDDALNQMGMSGKKLISTPTSKEANSVGKKSPMQGFKGFDQ